MAVSECLGKEENVLIHGNIGVSYLKFDKKEHTTITYGLGTQIKTWKGLHTIGEVFSGDPYVPGSGLAFQAGFRHFVNNFVQLDLTIGKGISGEHQLPLWYGGGVRLVTNWFEKKNKKEIKDL